MSHLIVFIIALLCFNNNGISKKNTIHLDENGKQYTLKSFNICNGFIYALDTRQKSIFMYNKDGSFIKSTLADGRGPGEFENIPNRIFCLSSGDIHLVETNRFHYFSSNLDFIEAKLFDPVLHLNLWQLAEVLAEFDTTFLVSFTNTSLLSNNQYAIISKENLNVEKSFGFSGTTSNRILGRGASIFSNDKILTALALTGDVIIYNITNDSYHLFNIQNVVSIKELERIAPSRIHPNDRDSMKFLEDGFIINNIALYNTQILTIQNKYAEYPGEQLDIYSLEGKLLSSLPLPENISRFTVVNNKLYGLNDFETKIHVINLNID